jgi:phage head-tail adaptor, putative, SPP1 family
MANKLLVNRMDKRIGIYRPVDPDETDEYGEPLDGPIKVCDVWAAIEPLRGQDRYIAKQEQADVTTRIRIRYRDGIDRTMIAKYGEIEFEILYIIHPDFAKTELQLMCKERQ